MHFNLIEPVTMATKCGTVGEQMSMRSWRNTCLMKSIDFVRQCSQSRSDDPCSLSLIRNSGRDSALVLTHS